MLAALPFMGMFAQPFWGQIADRTGSRSFVLATITALAALGFLALAAADGFVQLLTMTAFLALFSYAVIPIGVSVCFASLGAHGAERFGLVRVWGTIGYLLFVVGFPQVLRYQQNLYGTLRVEYSEPLLEMMFPATALLTIVAALIAWRLPRDGAATIQAAPGDWRLLLHNFPLVRLLLFTFGAYFCLQGPITLFPVYIRSLGGNMDTIGRMWVMMLLLEIPLVAGTGASLTRIGARGLLGIGAAAGGLRWAICGFSNHLPTIYAAQLLHGVVVAGLMIGGPLYLEAVVPQRLRSTGQTFLSTAGICFAGILSSVISGWLIEAIDVKAPYMIGGLGALALGCAVTWLLPLPHPGKEREVVQI